MATDSKELFRLVAENVTDFAVFMTDLGGRVLSWNPGVESLLGYAEGEWLGRNASVIFTPEDLVRGADRREMETALAEGRAEDRRWHLRKDGSLFWADGFLMLLRGARGEPLCFAKILRDDTARKRAEDERERLLRTLENERSRMEQILQQIPAGVNVVEAPTGRRLFSNAEAEALIGHPVALEEGYKHYARFGALHTDGRGYEPEEYPTVRALLRGEAIKGEEMLYRRPDGRLATLSVNSTPIRDAEGRIVAAATVFTDITGRKLRERERERFLSVGSDLLAVGDFDRRFLWVSPAWERTLGWTPEEITAREWLAFVHPEDLERTAAQAERVFAGEEVVAFENRYRHRDGTYRWLDWRVKSYPDEGRLYCAATDVTARKQAETERERLFEEAQGARLAAEEANRLKDEFLATLSHELRTPLTSILGWARLLAEGRLDASTARKALETIDRNATAQTQIIEDVLDVSRIISGKLRLQAAPVDLASVVQGAADAVTFAAEAKGVRLSLEPGRQPVMVTGDATRLQQVVWNLLANAVKFTDAGGGVRVSLGRVGPQAEIAVSDTGQGISPDVLPHVFERFRQAEGGTDRRHGGLGLGLAIVRHLVELHGGEVKAESAGPGLGATFRVRLPLVAALTSSALADVGGEGARAAGGGGLNCPPELNGLRVVVVDDDEDSRVLVTSVLRMCGAEVTPVGSAREALGEVERLRPDVLVSDLGMPGEDGYWLIKQVRALPEERGGKTPAAVLTAYARAEDRVRSLRAGFQNYVTKPAEPQELVAVVSNLAGRLHRGD